MKKQKRYKHRVSWVEGGKLHTEWFSNHKKAESLYDDKVLRGFPVYYARKISDALTAYMFDRIKSDNGFGDALVNLSGGDHS